MSTTCARPVEVMFIDHGSVETRQCILFPNHYGVCRNAAPWYMTAPNPTCSTLCDVGHVEGEFANGGGMLCRQPLATKEENGLYSVEVQHYVGTNETEDGYRRDPANLYVDIAGDDFLDPVTARAFAALVVEGAAIAEEANR